MIKEESKSYLKWFFILVEYKLLKSFAKLKFIGNVRPAQDKGTLLLMNHFSFNDGGIVYRFCRKILGKEFKAMVIEQQLKSFSLLKYGGCFSVNKKSKTVIASLQHAADLLAESNNMLAIFPQGEVFSTHLNKIHFEGGVAKILKKTTQPIQIIFAVTLLDYLDGFKPTANLYYQEYNGNLAISDMENAYNQFYRECKIKQQQQHNPPQEVIGFD